MASTLGPFYSQAFFFVIDYFCFDLEFQEKGGGEGNVLEGKSEPAQPYVDIDINSSCQTSPQSRMVETGNALHMKLYGVEEEGGAI